MINEVKTYEVEKEHVPRRRAETEPGGEFLKLFLTTAFTEGNLSQVRVSRILCVSPSFVNAIARGRRLPAPHHIELLCAALRVPEERRKELHRLGARASGWDV